MDRFKGLPLIVVGLVFVDMDRLVFSARFRNHRSSGAGLQGSATYLDGTARADELAGRFAILFRERANEVAAIRELPVGGDF